MLYEVEEERNRFFHFTGSEGLPLDHFAIVEAGPRAEIEEQSVPFREGEEVHVDIVEPHMYSEDDAVAKVDGYLIEVADAIGHVGEKMLVRIEQAGRTTARAVLAGDAAEAAAAATVERRQARARRQASGVGVAEPGAQEAGARAGGRGAERGGRGGRDARRRRRRRARRHRAGGGRRGRRGHRQAEGPAALAGTRQAGWRGRGRRARRRVRRLLRRRRVRRVLGGRRRRGIIQASAPWPQGRTAPFACERRGSLRSQRVT